MKAVRIHQPGGPEVLTLETLPDPAPGHGEIVVRVEHAGVNFIDTYHRSGRYPLDLPITLGMEGAGTVSALGDGVTGFEVGDRVAWGFTQGSYADMIALDHTKVVRLPDGVTTELAAAAMLQGMTAHYLVTSVYSAGPETVALVHAAAGGVGLLLTQMLAQRGATVIGTVSTDEKAHAARQAGCHHIIRYDREDLAQGVSDITSGKKCHVVYDGVGQSTFEGSLASLRPRGVLALFGASSGPVPPFDLLRLGPLGSLSVTRPTLAHFVATPDEHQWRAGDVLSSIADGTLSITIGGRYGLDLVADAHRDLESRATSGKLLLRVGSTT